MKIKARLFLQAHYFTWTEKAVSWSVSSRQITDCPSLYSLVFSRQTPFLLNLHSIFRMRTVCQGLSLGFSSLTALLWGAFQGSAFPSSLSMQKCTLRGRKKTLWEGIREHIATLLATSNKMSPVFPSKYDVSQVPLSWFPCTWKVNSPMPPDAYKHIQNVWCQFITKLMPQRGFKCTIDTTEQKPKF